MDNQSLDSNYAGTGFNKPLGFGKKPGVILIDPLQAYFTEGAPLYHPLFRSSLESSVRIVEAARRLGVTVAITRMDIQKDGVGGGVFYEKLSHCLSCLEPGNSLGEFAPELTVEESDIIISKRYPSAFFGTGLASALTTLGVDTVLLCGVSTSGCVRASCVDAISLGFRPMVIREAVGDRHPEVQKANLYDMNAKYADVISEDTAMQYLEQLSRI